MKRSLKISAILLIIILCFTGCNMSVENNAPIQDSTQTVHESSGKKSENSSANSGIKENSSKNEDIQSSVVKESEGQSEISYVSSQISENESSEESEAESSIEESSDEVVSEKSDIQSSIEESSDEPEKILDESMVYELDKKYFVQELDEQLYNFFIS